MTDPRTPSATPPIGTAARRSRPFLTARWENLILITFRAPEEAVRSALHPALEPDSWNGAVHVSLVAFDFRDTRVSGWRVPGYSRFPEINLRTYARRGSQRGVVFIKELVPHRLIALVARLVYNEPYRALTMSSRTRTANGAITVRHRFGSHRIEITGSNTETVPPEHSQDHHFKEHEWGFGIGRDGGLMGYRVEHPVWAVREIRQIEHEVNFQALYGATWAFLDQCAPISTIFATGSAVRVYRPLPLA